MPGSTTRIWPTSYRPATRRGFATFGCRYAPAKTQRRSNDAPFRPVDRPLSGLRPAPKPRSNEACVWDLDAIEEPSHGIRPASYSDAPAPKPGVDERSGARGWALALPRALCDHFRRDGPGGHSVLAR